MGYISGYLFLFLQTIFSVPTRRSSDLTEILEHTMLKFTIYGGDNFTWLGQGMYIMLGCLFLFSGQFLLIYGAFFHFWQRSEERRVGNFFYCVYLFVLRMEKYWATYLCDS